MLIRYFYIRSLNRIRSNTEIQSLNMFESDIRPSLEGHGIFEYTIFIFEDSWIREQWLKLLICRSILTLIPPKIHILNFFLFILIVQINRKSSSFQYWIKKTMVVYMCFGFLQLTAKKEFLWNYVVFLHCLRIVGLIVWQNINFIVYVVHLSRQYMQLYSYALSFYRSQNVLCRSKFFEPAQKFDCI